MNLFHCTLSVIKESEKMTTFLVLTLFPILFCLHNHSLVFKASQYLQHSANLSEKLNLQFKFVCFLYPNDNYLETAIVRVNWQVNLAWREFGTGRVHPGVPPCPSLKILSYNLQSSQGWVNFMCHCGLPKYPTFHCFD